MRLLAGLAVVLLAACGVDGAPEPVDGPLAPGARIDATASVGVTGSF